MALSNTNNFITTLISTGNDALSHLYEVVFEGGYLTQYTTDLSVRCDGFTPPEINQETYTVKYITAYIDRPKTKINVDRFFNLKFRVDSNWLLYKALLNQQKLTMNPSQSFVNSDINELIESGLLFNVHVNKIKKLNETEEQQVDRLFNFTHCWIESITPSDFSNENSDVMTVDCKINFMKMEDWQSGLTGDDVHGSKISENIGSVNYE